MNNKRLGNSFEQELAQIFYKHGFWVHCFASKAAGQPVDLIACKNDVGVIIDAKVCSDDVFDTARMEENQRNSMMLFDYCGNSHKYYALKMADDMIYICSGMVLMMHRQEKRVLNRHDIEELGIPLDEWFRRCDI